MNGKAALLAAMHAAESGRPRNRQAAPGPSSVGSCRRQVWLRLRSTTGTNRSTKSLSAFMGTAIHDHLSRGLAAHDPFRYEIEFPVAAEGVVGHVDVYDREEFEVIDWKSTTKKSLGWLTKNDEDGRPVLGAAAGSWPAVKQMWQVQVYGWLLEQNGRPVKRVTLVGLARDGDEDHVREWSGEYDEQVAREALAWIAEVRDSEVMPPAERGAGYCRSYCPFWTADGSVCAGMAP